MAGKSRSSAWRLCSWLLITVIAVVAVGQPQAAPKHEASVRPGVNERYKNGTEPVEVWVDRFERKSREIYSRRDKIVSALRLKKGERVADIGAGTGFFSMMFAKAVGPKGKVFAVDINPKFIQLIKGRAAKANIDNIETVLCKDDSAELPDASVDVVFICDTYHHFEYPRSTLASIRRALRPGGRMVVIDFYHIKGKSSDWTMRHVRAGRETFKAEIVAAGFEWVDDGPDAGFLKQNYLMRFRKPRGTSR